MLYVVRDLFSELTTVGASLLAALCVITGSMFPSARVAQLRSLVCILDIFFLSFCLVMHMGVVLFADCWLYGMIPTLTNGSAQAFT